MLDAEGKPKFGELVSRSRLRTPMSIRAAARATPAVILAFDLLELQGADMRPFPLLERKAQLKEALAGSNRLCNVEHVDDGLGLFVAVEEAGLEGIVAKKALAHYRRGRTGDWIKTKTTAGRAPR